MMKRDYDIIIIGGGPAGLAAAVAAYDSYVGEKQDIPSILIIERDRVPGGILNQCIHNGFGLHTFNEELTGPEYASRFITEVEKRNIEIALNTMVIDLSGNRTVTAMNRTDGLVMLHARAIILAMGCRERPRGALNIPGHRPAGIYTAGTAQRLVNIEGLMPGREVVILGSGDIGLIMARRMTLEGAKVKAVAELMPYSGGLKRNIVQCLEDFNIPLLLSHTVVDIKGKDRVEAVVIAEVDEHQVPIPGIEVEYSCDTLLLSCGLLPENELSKSAGITLNSVTGGPLVNESLETDAEGIFACGNVLHVHDLVDYVSQEASNAGKQAAAYCLEKEAKASVKDEPAVTIITENGVRYSVPSVIRPAKLRDELTVRFRVANVYKNCFVDVFFDERRVIHRKRRIVSPGEMESVVLNKSMFEEGVPAGITIKLEYS